MFLGIIGALMVIVIVAALVSGKGQPVPLFIFVPIIAALIAGYSPTEIFGFMKTGVGVTWSTAVLFIFSIIYFSMMSDLGLFDPLVNFLVKKAGNNTIMVTVSTMILATISHLDGALAATMLITIPAMLPIYKKMHMRPVVLVCLIGAAFSVMNLMPWGGPVARTGVVLGVDVNIIWHKLIPLQIVGCLVNLAFAVYMGIVEKRRGAGIVPVPGSKAAMMVTSNEEISADDQLSEEDAKFMKKPQMFWFNLLLTLGVIALLCFTKIPMYGAFMIGLALALMVNFPKAKDQARAMKMHAATAVSMPMILLASGVFLGVLDKSGMMHSMAEMLVAVIPNFLGPHLQDVFGFLAVPIGMLLGTDSYFFGLMPLAINVGQSFGVSPESMSMAMLIGKNYGVLVTPQAATTYLACGLAGISLRKLIVYCAPYMWILSWISLALATVLGLFAV
ncbi:MAG: SLC13 family permease [Veillonellaceae bacterium]|nr:SLC13 family permease [Veillonellaceae bacterium]